MGIIVLAVAILPLLGVGGAQLFKAETAGPMKDQKLTPRIAETARGLWAVYFATAAACFVAYRAGRHELGRRLHAHVQHHGPGRLLGLRRQLRPLPVAAIEAVAIVFMLLAGINFALYFVAWRKRSLAVLWRTSRRAAFLLLLAARC
jgi:trk system potassium uptake protein TrkH